MPELRLHLTDDEHAGLSAAARAQGMSLEQFALTALVASAVREEPMPTSARYAKAAGKRVTGRTAATRRKSVPRRAKAVGPEPWNPRVRPVGPPEEIAPEPPHAAVPPPPTAPRYLKAYARRWGGDGVSGDDLI